MNCESFIKLILSLFPLLDVQSLMTAFLGVIITIFVTRNSSTPRMNCESFIKLILSLFPLLDVQSLMTAFLGVIIASLWPEARFSKVPYLYRPKEMFLNLTLRKISWGLWVNIQFLFRFVAFYRLFLKTLKISTLNKTRQKNIGINQVFVRA